jgi:hypothetical protein
MPHAGDTAFPDSRGDVPPQPVRSHKKLTWIKIAVTVGG